MPIEMNKSQQFTKVLNRYVPEHFVEMVVRLVLKYPVVFKIVKPRKSKLGDFRGKNNAGKMQITINANLNQYNFLITTLHEFAHLITYIEFGHRVSPHGIEWQEHFKKLLVPVIESGELPADVEAALQKSIINVKASSCSDQNLSRVLMKYDEGKSNQVLLEELEIGAQFSVNGKTFVKGVLRRSRFMCEEIQSGKKYLVNALAKVEELSND